MMKRYAIITLLTICVALQITSVSSENTEISIAGISANEVECVNVGQKNTCNLVDNIINVTLVIDNDIVESNLMISDGDEYLKTLSHGCEMVHKSLYSCYFEIDPIIELSSDREYQMTINLYPKGGGTSFSESLGLLKIKVVRDANIFDISAKKKKCIGDSSYLNNFAKDTVFNSGLCAMMGTDNISFNNIATYEDELNLLNGYVSDKNSDITIMRATKLLASLSLLNDRTFFGESTNIDNELNNILYYGYTAGFMTRKIPSGEEYFFSPWREWGISEKIETNCKTFEENFSLFINPLLLLTKRYTFLSCLEKSRYENCINEFWSANENVDSQRKETLANLKIFINGELLRDGSNICSGSGIKIEHENLEKVGVNHIEVLGKDADGCVNTLLLTGDENLGGSFLCGYPDRPRDEGKYEITIPLEKENITYSINYYDDPSKCRVHQISVPVD